MIYIIHRILVYVKFSLTYFRFMKFTLITIIKLKNKNKYLEQNKHFPRYIIRQYKIQEAGKLEEE